MRITILIISILIATSAVAQDTSLLKMMDDSMAVYKQKIFVTGTFKSVYIINTQTVEAPAKHVLLF